jgi:hypothetical protein
MAVHSGHEKHKNLNCASVITQEVLVDFIIPTTMKFFNAYKLFRGTDETVAKQCRETFEEKYVDKY